MAPYREQSKERFQIEGSSLPLPPKATLALSLALHELCTNAVKYGALSTREGRVCIRWHAATDRFRLTWEEIGGPPVSQPKRQGFGSVLITRVLADDLDGLVKLDYRPSGLICTVEAPLSGSNAEGDLRQ